MKPGDAQDLAARIEGLEAELVAARARGEERGLLALRELELEAEIRAVRTRLEARAKRAGSLLDELRVASPCAASWDEMEGDDRVRHCKACDRQVFYLSAMTTLEAERLLAEHESPCVRLWQRADGTVLTADCPVGRRRLRVRNVIAVAGSAAVLAALAVLQSDPAPVVRVAERGLGRARSVTERTAQAASYDARLRDVENRVEQLKHMVMGAAPRRVDLLRVPPSAEPKKPPPPARGDKST